MVGQFMKVSCKDCGNETVIFSRNHRHLLHLRRYVDKPIWRKSEPRRLYCSQTME